MLQWLFSLTDHELNVLRTVAIVIGSGCVPAFGLVLTWFARIIKRNSSKAAEQTATTHWVNGEQRPISVAEYAKHSVLTGEATRQEVSDFRTEWVRGNGKRRNPTGNIPRLGESKYESG